MSNPPASPNRGRTMFYPALALTAMIAGLGYFWFSTPPADSPAAPDQSKKAATPAAGPKLEIRPTPTTGNRVELRVEPPTPRPNAQVPAKPADASSPYADPELEKKIAQATTFVKSEIRAPLLAYRAHTGSYPDSDAGLRALLVSTGVPGWHGPYITGTAVPLDPWGRPYRYSFPGTHGDGTSFDAWSLGPSGKEDADDVIGNWSK